MYFRICCFIITALFVNTTSVSSQNKSNDNINAYFKRLGIQVIKPADYLETPRVSSQNLVEMQVSLKAQQNQQLVDASVLKKESIRPVAGNFTILGDNFEGAFPGKDWQILHKPQTSAWGRYSANAISGSFSLWCGSNPFYNSTTASGEYPDNTLTWLVFRAV